MYKVRDFLKYVEGRKIAVYGTGCAAYRSISNIWAARLDAEFFVSRDFKDKPAFAGKAVYGNERLDRRSHYVFIASEKYAFEIAQNLHALGFRYEHDYGMAFGMGEYQDNPLVTVDYDRFIGDVRIGKYSNIHSPYIRSRLYCVDSIGRFSAIANTVQISTDHAMKVSISSNIPAWTGIDSGGGYKPHINRVKIGNDAWIGANAFINASKVRTIGDGAIIGTGAVVLEDVPPYAIVVGMPGKVKKYRFSPEQIECLLRVKWWDWTDEEKDRYAKCLYNPELFFETFMY